MGMIAGLAGCGLASLPPINETPQPTSVIFVPFWATKTPVVKVADIPEGPDNWKT